MDERIHTKTETGQRKDNNAGYGIHPRSCMIYDTMSSIVRRNKTQNLKLTDCGYVIYIKPQLSYIASVGLGTFGEVGS